MRIACLFVLLLLLQRIPAQELSNRIGGAIRDMNSKPIAGASILLERASDTGWKRTAITDDKGRFVFTRLETGTFILAVTHVGYGTFRSGHILLDGRHFSIELPAIVLRQSSGQSLQEVDVVSRKPLIEQHIDRTTVNVESMISAAGSSALEVLSRSPGVSVGNDGTLSLNGKSGALVLIDDKPTYMSDQDLANYLRSLPGAVLDKIELMTNPPARYDASGNSVINIRLKKSRNRGFNGNISAGYTQGWYGRTNDALNINYRSNKVNVFSSVSCSGDRNYNNIEDKRHYFNPDGSPASAVYLGSGYRYDADAVNARVGLDHFISSRTTWGLVLNGNTRPRNDRLEYLSSQYSADMKIDSITTGYSRGAYKWTNGGVNLNFQHRFDSAGNELSADLDYIVYHSRGDQLSGNTVSLPDHSPAGGQDIRYLLASDISIYSAKADYSHPFRGRWRVDGGLKSSYVRAVNSTDLYDLAGALYMPDPNRSDKFQYRENVNAFYLNAHKEWTRWVVQAGLRMENTLARGHQPAEGTTPDSSFTKKYTSLFPTLYLSYSLDKNGAQSLVMSLGRRILRPHYQDLNPFLIYHDRFSYTAGNPYLDPSYNYHAELSYKYRKYLTATVAYDHVNGIIFQSTEAAGLLFVTRPENLAVGHYIGLFVNSSVSPSKWWSVNANARLAQFVNKGTVNSERLDQVVNNFAVDVFNQFKLGKGLSAELSGFYAGRMIWGQTIGDPLYAVNAGLQRSILKDKGTVRIKMDDIFHTLVTHERTTNIRQASDYNKSRTDSQRIGISLSYRFGKSANGRKRAHNADGADAEKDRVN